MINPFRTWIDTIALILIIIITAALTYFAAKKAEGNLRLVAVFFLFLGPVTVGVNMTMHTLYVLYEAFSAIINNTFTYNFKLYSLLLVGVVLIYQSISMLKHGMAKCMARLDNMIPIYKNIIFISLISISMIPFAPIGTLPIISCITTLISLRFIHKFRDIAPNAFI